MQLAFAFMLTPDEVAAQVAALKEAVRIRDYELALSLEITIWHEVLEAIAEGAWDVQDLAKTALTTTNIKYPRWA